eukprot:m.10977 g.10977  ORF g.10977 m.10977 type:complete len:337 (-) comp14611_c0_seq1:1639-2649(-)
MDAVARRAMAASSRRRCRACARSCSAWSSPAASSRPPCERLRSTRRRTRAYSTGALKGLRTKSSPPKASARASWPMVLDWVRNMMGTWLRPGSARSCLQTRKPSLSGRSMSSRMRSGCSSPASARACAPFNAKWHSPTSASRLRTSWMLVVSSSMMRMRAGPLAVASGLAELVAVARNWVRSRASTCTSSKGLRRKSSAPSLRAATSVAASQWLLAKMTGMSRRAGAARSRRQTSKPPRSGSSTSSSTRSGWCSSASRSASSPLVAKLICAKPLSSWPRYSMVARSSSTTSRWMRRVRVAGALAAAAAAGGRRVGRPRREGVTSLARVTVFIMFSP